MRQKHWIFALAAFGWLLLLLVGSAARVAAQESTYEIGHTEVFGKLRRQPVFFDHDLHMDVDEEAGCGACHHVYDEKAGRLVDADGEETACTECHGAKRKGHTPSLREAFHGNCTGCHRARLKAGESAGPTTCGECHAARP